MNGDESKTDRKSRYWCFTLNNPTENEYTYLTSLDLPRGLSYICVGRERGASGTPHLQGYIECAQRVKLSGIRKILSSTRYHLEQRRGTQSEAITYCKKDGDWKESGVPVISTQGKRTDLIPFIDELRSGKSLQSVALDFPEIYCRYRNGLRDISRWVQPTRTEPPSVTWISGEPGVGKTRWVYEFALQTSQEIWTYPGARWFDGYSGQPIVLFDDFGDDEIPAGQRAIEYTLFLRLTDRYPMSVEVKGGFVQWTPKHIFFTSNRVINLLYCKCNLWNPDAITRRVGTIKHM